MLEAAAVAELAAEAVDPQVLELQGDLLLAARVRKERLEQLLGAVPVLCLQQLVGASLEFLVKDETLAQIGHKRATNLIGVLG